jgi:hypothetical protein
MPAFGFNRFTIPFLQAILYRQNTATPPVTIGFRLSDRIQSALDRLHSDLVTTYSNDACPALKRWAYLYPFVGATDWSHAMNMADIDGGYKKYTITWSGAMTHTELGILGAGNGNTNADCGSYVDPAKLENWVHKSFGFYSRTNNQGTERTMDAINPQVQPNGYTYSQHIHPRYSDGNVYARNTFYSNASASGGNVVVGSCGFSNGLYSLSRMVGGNDMRLTLNGTNYWAVDTTAPNGLGYGDGKSDGSFMKIFPTNRQLAFVFQTIYAQTLTPAENVTFYTIIQRFQIGMGRAV